MLNPRYIATFLAVVDTGSLRAAAAARGLSPATVSHQIRRLEAAVGAGLIERGSPCRASPAGARFRPHAEALLRVQERALAAVAQQGVRLGAASNIGVYLLPPVLRALRDQRLTDERTTVRIDSNPAINARLAEGSLDLALVEDWQPHPGLQAARWRDEPMHVIVPPGHAWAGRQRITREELSTARLLAGEPGTGTGRLLRAFLAECDHGPVVSEALGSTEAVKQAVAHGLGVSLVLAGTVTPEVAAGRLVSIPLAGGLSKPLWAAWRREARDPALSRVLSALGTAA